MASLSVTFDDGTSMLVDNLTTEELRVLGDAMVVGLDGAEEWIAKDKITKERYELLWVLADDIGRYQSPVRVLEPERVQKQKEEGQ